LLASIAMRKNQYCKNIGISPYVQSTRFINSSSSFICNKRLINIEVDEHNKCKYFDTCEDGELIAVETSKKKKKRI
jgi:hypothetical protein